MTPIVPGMRPIESLTLALAEKLSDRSLKTIREDLEDDSARGLHLLASQVAKRSETRVVLLVDQFEEVFTQTTSEKERQRFLDILMAAITEPCGPLVVLLTLRADFYDRPSQYPELALLIKDHHQLVLPMDMKDLHAIIEKPAALPDVQLTFEGDLVGDLLFEMQGQAGALPLLQFTLEQLFQKRNGHLLTLSAYREMGGVKGALTRHAESTYAALPSDEHRRLARALFVRLIDPGVTEQDTTRRRASLLEFALTDATETHLLRETADAFIAARLLTTNEVAGIATLEVSHEALIREWPRLATWLREAREDILLQQAISGDVSDWIRRGKPVDDLYRGTKLIEAQAWAERNMPSIDEAAFLRASVEEQQRQENKERSRQARELNLQHKAVNRLRILIAAFSVFLVLAIILSSVAGWSLLQLNAARQDVQRERLLAKSESLALQATYALSKNQLDQSLLLSVRANQTYDTFDARDSLLTALEYSPRLLTKLRGNRGLISSLAFSPDGQTLTAFNQVGSGLSWDLKTRQRHASDLALNVSSATFIRQLVVSSNGELLAAITNGPGCAGCLWVQNIKAGTPIVQLEGDIKNRPQNVTSFGTIAFSSDGKLLASSRCIQYVKTPQGGYRCTQGQIVLWNVGSTPPSSQLLTIQPNLAGSLVFSPDGKTLAASMSSSTQDKLGGTVQLWNIASRSLMSQLPVPTSALNIAFSLNGKKLASGNSDGTINVWDVASEKLVGAALAGHAGPVQSVALSPDGNTLAASIGSSMPNNLGGTVQLWKIATQSPYLALLPIGQPLVGHTGQISNIVFSPDSKILASGDTAGTIILWNMAPDSPINRKLEYTGDVRSAIFTPDGQVVITGDTTGKIVLRNVATGELLGTLDATGEPMDIPGGRQYIGDPPLTVESLAMSPDGKTLVAGRFDGMIFLWDWGSRKLITHFPSEPRLKGLVFNPSTQLHMVASSYEDGSILLWDIMTGKVLYRLTHQTLYTGQLVPGVAFSRDGKLLASGDRDMVVFWDVATGKKMGQTLVGHTGQISSVVFSPDGHTLASKDTSGTTLLWDMTTGKSISLPSSNLNPIYPSNPQGTITFSPDGALLALSGYISVSLWDMARSEFVAHAFQPPYGVRGVIFSPNGQQLVTISGQRLVTTFESHLTLWDVNTVSWQAHACNIANRNFTLAEWKQYEGDTPYQKVCPNLPIDAADITGELAQAHAAVQKRHLQEASSLYTQAVHWADGDALESSYVCLQGGIDQLAQVVIPACENAVKLEPNDPDIRDSRGLARASAGDTGGAAADFSQATQLALESGDANVSNDVCWFGSLAQFAQLVMPACEHAVEMYPNNPDVRDSRGLARALVGDTEGAIADYQFVVQSVNAHPGYPGWTTDQIKERQMWLQELEAGHNPFDAKTLQALQVESIPSITFYNA